MMKKVLLGILSIALFVVLSFAIFSNKDNEIQNISSTGASVVAFGDSLVEGVGASFGNDFVSILGERIGIDIVNLGISGNTTSQGLKRVQDVVDINPKVVIVLLGGNDALRKVPVETTFKNLRDVVTTIHDSGSAVILVGIQSGIFGDSFKSEFKKLAKDMNTGFVPDILDDIFGDPKLMADPIHPNDDGYKIIADRIEPVLREILEQKI